MESCSDEVVDDRVAIRRRTLLWATALLAAGLLALAPSVLTRPASAAGTARHGPATAGVVNIFTKLGYQSASAAGTGIIVSPSGEVLTNNHVIRGATSIRVVDVSTKRSYSAAVVGYTVQGDLAVLQLANASGLKTIPLGNSAKLRVGQAVTALGNQGGTGNTVASPGTITRLHRTIVAHDDQGGSERLTNLIETNADVQPGDSGGPLVDAAGRTVGIVSAGSVSFRFQDSTGLGYAIPINKARAFAKLIRAGQASNAIHVGPTAFLGVSVRDAAAGGAEIVAVVPGSAADAAGVAPNDVVTSLNGVSIGSGADLQKAVLSLTPGTTVGIGWSDSFGTPQTAQITPVSGPPQ
jgi:S1-C subfamily serine protease